MTPETNDNQEERIVKFKWPIQESEPIVWANQFAITRTENEVVLRMGQFAPNFAHRTSEEIEEYVDSEAQVRPVATIAMTLGAFAKFMEMLNRNISSTDMENGNE